MKHPKILQYIHFIQHDVLVWTQCKNHFNRIIVTTYSSKTIIPYVSCDFLVAIVHVHKNTTAFCIYSQEMNVSQSSGVQDSRLYVP